ncbi:MAG: aminoacetone oxidase family FAD-binding enzyme, partial [Gordonibacter urolithinfaciens]
MGRLAIIGGGAAGLAAAVTAARELRLLGVPGDVAVYEADERVGRSILATGNGRCNFSNARIDAGAYRNAAFVEAALGALAACSEEMAGLAPEGTCGAAGPDPVHAFFAGLGLVWREEGEGRLYPLANKATSVLDVLRAAAADFGVREACGRRAVRLDVPDRPGGRVHIRFADGTVGHADAVVLATGGRTARELLPEGIGFAAARPVLGPLRTATDVVRHLNNLRVRCAVTLAGPDGAPKAREAGELLFRDYGVSGIAVFNLSRFAEPGDRLLVDLLPQVPEDGCAAFLHARRRRLAFGDRPLSR